MSLALDDLPSGFLAHLGTFGVATIATVRPDGSPHVVAIGMTWEAQSRQVWAITNIDSVKARNIFAGSRAAVTTVAGGSWVTLEGPARISEDPDDVTDAVARYASRYGDPPPSMTRVALVIDADRALGMWR